jgi:hypothetical protein
MNRAGLRTTLSAVLRVLSAALLAVVVVGSLIEEDPFFQKWIARAAITRLQALTDADFQLAVDSVSLLAGEVQLKQLKARSKPGKPSWSWEAARGHVTISWWHLLIGRAVPVSIILSELHAFSTWDEAKPALYDHLVSYASAPQGLGIVELAGLTISNASLVCEHGARLHGAAAGAVTLIPTRTAWLLKGTFQGAHLHADATLLAREGTGSFQLTLGGDEVFALQAHIIANSPLCGGKAYKWQLSASPAAVQGNWYLHDIQEFQGDFSVQNGQVQAQGTLPVTTLLRLLDINPAAVGGACSMSAHASTEELAGSARLLFDIPTATWNGVQLPQTAISIDSLSDGMRGSVRSSGPYACSGVWSYEPDTHLFTLKIAPAASISITEDSWLIDQAATQLDLEIKKGIIKGAYTIQAASRAKKGSYKIKGAIDTQKDTSLVVSAEADGDLTALATIANQPCWYLRKITVLQKGAKIAQMSMDQSNHFAGHMVYAPIKLLLHTLFGLHFAGQGNLYVNGAWEQGQLIADVSSSHMNVRLAHAHNVVEKIAAHITLQPEKRTLVMEKGEMTLRQGSVRIAGAEARFDADWRLAHARLPLNVCDAFIKWQSNMYALIAADLLATYSQGKQPQVDGFILLDKLHMKSNPFSSSTGQDLVAATLTQLAYASADPRIDLQVSTYSPARFSTDSVTATARFAAQVIGKLSQPQICGELQVLGGKIMTPSEPLTISSGHIYFTPTTYEDPAVSLSAYTAIKHYFIEIGVQGSVSAPIIRFGSTPSLSQEQIISLILGGDEESSFAITAPSVIGTTLQSLIFGAQPEASGLIERSLSKIFHPFEAVRITPSLTDQTGRGGVRGALAIKVKDRLSGRVTKNFTLPEDARIEVNYALSDDTSIRGIKDERGNLGAEVEMRWKL